MPITRTAPWENEHGSKIEKASSPPKRRPGRPESYPDFSTRRRVVISLYSTCCLASGILCAIIAHRYNPLRPKTPGPKTNEDNRQHNIKNENYLYYLPSVRAMARLRAQTQDYLVLQISRRKTLEKLVSQLHCHIQRLRLPRIFDDPTPSLFLAACIFYAFAITAFRHVHRKDRYQDYILWLGVAFGLVGACLLENNMLELKSYLAWSVIIALALSSLVHRVLGLFASRKTKKQEFQGTLKA